MNCSELNVQPGKTGRVAQPSTLPPPTVWWRWWRACWGPEQVSPLLTTVEILLPLLVPSKFLKKLCCQSMKHFQRDEDTATCLAMILALYLSTPTSETRKSLRSMSSLGSLRKSEGGLGRLSLCLAELDMDDREMENSR